MEKRRIVISIADDKQSCFVKGLGRQTISNVKAGLQQGIKYNVHIAKTPSGKEYIKYNKNCAPKDSGKAENQRDFKNIQYSHGTKTYNLKVIIEDSSSANDIILNIIEIFAKENRINFNIQWLSTHGIDHMPYYLLNKININDNCLVIYDSAYFEDNISVKFNSVEAIIDYLRHRDINIVAFSPRCSEECALSFEILNKDIKVIDQQYINILIDIQKYLHTGKDYKQFNTTSNRYEIGNIPINFGYQSRHLREKVTNIERFLADVLAEITDNNPYEFIKDACVCWSEDCKVDEINCALRKKLGSMSPRPNVNNCNKTIYDCNKTEMIISHSLFAGVYDALAILTKCTNRRILNNLILSIVIK